MNLSRRVYLKSLAAFGAWGAFGGSRFAALAATLAAIVAAAAPAEPQLYMAGDSIMAEYKPSEWPQYGWGQALAAFMKEPENLHNFARSG